MTLSSPARSRLHWHANANEWNYCVGNGQIALFGSGGRGKVAEVHPAGSAYFPEGFGHAIMNAGDDDLEIVQTWDNGKFEEITLKHWMETAPNYLLSNNFAGVPAATVDKLQQG